MTADAFRTLKLGYAAARDAIAEAGGRHDHSKPGGCRVCAASEDAAELVRDTVMSTRGPASTALVTYRCWRCRDTEWCTAEESTDDELVVMPCPNCAPATYERWASGHYERNHGPCSECTDVRRGSRP